MQIKRSSWHYKISNLGSDFERSSDNLCCYFWRFVGKLALFFVTMALIGYLVYAYFSSDQLVRNTLILLFLFSLVIVPALTISFIRKKLGKSPEMPYGNIVVEYIAAKKRKVCPLIEYI